MTTRANVLAAQYKADAKPAPAAVFFDKGEWAHRGRVLAVVLQAARERGVSGGGEWLVLVIIAQKVLGLSLEPAGLLNAQSIAGAAGVSDRLVRELLISLAGRQLIEFERDGKEVKRCRIHPALFSAARDGLFAAGPVNTTAETSTANSAPGSAGKLAVPHWG